MFQGPVNSSVSRNSREEPGQYRSRKLCAAGGRTPSSSSSTVASGVEDDIRSGVQARVAIATMPAAVNMDQRMVAIMHVRPGADDGRSALSPGPSHMPVGAGPELPVSFQRTIGSCSRPKNSSSSARRNVGTPKTPTSHASRRSRSWSNLPSPSTKAANSRPSAPAAVRPLGEDRRVLHVEFTLPKAFKNVVKKAAHDSLGRSL